MRFARPGLVLALVSLTSTAHASIDINRLGDASWYIHIDFQEMKKAPAGKGVYDWFQSDVFEKIRAETGVDLGSKLETVTAYGRNEADAFFMLEGAFPADTETKIIRHVTKEGLKKASVAGKDYWRFAEESYGSDSVKIDLDDELYVSFALPNTIIASFNENRMRTVLKNGGDVPRGKPDPDTLFVLSAQRDLVQAGASAGSLDIEEDWDSKLVRNTKHVAVLIADSQGKLAVDAKLKAREPDMAESMANVIRGLIGLSYFSEDMEPGIASLLRTTKVAVNDGVLELSVLLDPDAFRDLVEE